MSSQFLYSGFAHTVNEVFVTNFSVERNYDQRGNLDTWTHRLEAIGTFIGNAQQCIDTQRTLEIQYGETPFTGATYLVNGTATDINLPSAGLSKPPRVRISFPMSETRAHFATGLDFQISIVAEYTNDLTSNLMDYQDSVQWFGTGSSLAVPVRLDQGPPDIQVPIDQTEVTIVQQGSAVGRFQYPAFGPPIFDLNNPQGGIFPIVPRISRGRATPQKVGNRFIGWRVRWTYAWVADHLPNIPNAPHA